MTLPAYLAQRPAKPTKITADCTLTNYYNFAYIHAAETHYCVMLKQDSPYGYGHAWASKTSDPGKHIYEALKDGLTHRLTLEVVLQGPDGLPTPAGNEEMAIVKVIR